MYLNTRISDYWLRTSAVIHVYKAWASGGKVQDVYFSLHTVIKVWNLTCSLSLLQACIEENYINGRHLILMDASTLPKIGIYDFEHIKVSSTTCLLYPVNVV